jgi:hypothetical protein
MLVHKRSKVVSLAMNMPQIFVVHTRYPAPTINLEKKREIETDRKDFTPICFVRIVGLSYTEHFSAYHGFKPERGIVESLRHVTLYSNPFLESFVLRVPGIEG